MGQPILAAAGFPAGFRGFWVYLHRRPAILLALLAFSCHSHRDPLPGFPNLILWAWDRPEHLRFIDPSRVGVAFLARTITWGNGALTWKPRYQPLDIPPATPVMAVIRLESESLPLPDPNTVATRIVETAILTKVPAIQIDFDARSSERDWYRSLLHEVRRKLSPEVTLNITALASWCLGDPWLGDLPVNDAVPMLFRMGQGEPKDITDFSAPVCRSSIGLSTDELRQGLPHGRRLFIFHPRPWTPQAFHDAMEIARAFQ